MSGEIVAIDVSDSFTLARSLCKRFGRYDPRQLIEQKMVVDHNGTLVDMTWEQAFKHAQCYHEMDDFLEAVVQHFWPTGPCEQWNGDIKADTKA